MKNNNPIQKTAMLMLTTLLAFHLSSLTMAASDDIPDLSGSWSAGQYTKSFR